MENNKKRVEFTPPKGWSPPESQGDDFDLVCTFRKKPDGQICLIKLGETDMPGYEEGEHDESREHMQMEGNHAPDYRSYSKGLMEGMGEQSQSANSY